MTNGSSELMSNISMSVVTLVYNYQLLNIAKENGVAAYGVIMYVSFIFIAIFIGYSISTAPIIGFHYGAKNREELKNLFKKSSAITLGAGLTMSVIAFLCAYPFSLIFVGDNEELLSMTVRGFRIFSASFIFSGFCIFSSSMFTALNNGPVSAVISFMRTLVYQLTFVILLPMFLGLDGIWLSMLLAEALAIITSFIIVLIKRKKYGYL
jgi:Na+-driven multidrug efflux pump